LIAAKLPHVCGQSSTKFAMMFAARKANLIVITQLNNQAIVLGSFVNKAMFMIDLP